MKQTAAQRERAQALRGKYEDRGNAARAAQELANITGRPAYSVVKPANSRQGHKYSVQSAPGHYRSAIAYTATPIIPTAADSVTPGVASSDPQNEDSAPTRRRVPYAAGEKVILGRGTYRLVTGGTWMVGVPREATVRDDEAPDGSLVVYDYHHTAVVARGAVARMRDWDHEQARDIGLDDTPAPDETFFCDLCDTPVPAGAKGDDVVCRGCGRVLSLAPSTPADPAPAIDRSTTIQTQSSSIQSRADAIRAGAQALQGILDGMPGLSRTNRLDLLAKLDGIAGNAMHIGAEAGLVITADEYQQGRRRAAESTLEALEAAGLVDHETLAQMGR